jgi:phenylpyruvate tautomerase PptA (4-oxalocrotonate tautomerase family)
MPLYTVTTQAGTLIGGAKRKPASDLTTFPTQYAMVAKDWVHIVFQDYAVGSGFAAGEPAATVALTLLIRNGRSADYKREMLNRLWKLIQSATGAPKEQIVLGIQELPASQAMEMGIVMPEPIGSHA